MPLYRPTAPVDTQVFTASGVYSKATAIGLGAAYIDIMMCGGGGGGGGGRSERTTGSLLGSVLGGGGGGTIIAVRGNPASESRGQRAFRRGVGGAGSVPGPGAVIPGNPGTAGGESQFFIYRTAGGAGGVAGFTSASITAGANSPVKAVGHHTDTLQSLPLYGQSFAITQVAGCGGGGGGAWINGARTQTFLDANADSVVSCRYLSAPQASATAAFGAAGAGGAPFATGGAGGANSNPPTAAAGSSGGNGALGSGGSGGSPCLNTAPISGAGGAGGTGWLVVFAYWGGGGILSDRAVVGSSLAAQAGPLVVRGDRFWRPE